jgi:hypothetical protein
MTPEAIEALLQRESGAAAGYDGGADDPARARRTELLSAVLLSAQRYWYAGSEEIDRVAEKLGDGCRECKCVSGSPGVACDG